MSPPRSINISVPEAPSPPCTPPWSDALPTPALTCMHLDVSWCPGAQELGFV